MARSAFTSAEADGPAIIHPISNFRSQILNSRFAISEVLMAIGQMLAKVFGSRNERLIKRYRRIVEQINELEPKVAAMSDEQLRQRTFELHEGLLDKKLGQDEVMHEAFAIIPRSMDRN